MALPPCWRLGSLEGCQGERGSTKPRLANKASKQAVSLSIPMHGFMGMSVSNGVGRFTHPPLFSSFFFF